MSQDTLRSLNCQHLELRLQTVQWDSLPWCLLITVQTRSPASIIGGYFKQILAPRSISALYEYCLIKFFFLSFLPAYLTYLPTSYLPTYILPAIIEDCAGTERRQRQGKLLLHTQGICSLQPSSFIHLTLLFSTLLFYIVLFWQL